MFNLFNTTRLKLTAWYVILIMLIVGILSLVVYRQTVWVLDNQFSAIESRLEELENRPLLRQRVVAGAGLLTDDLVELKEQIATRIFRANVAVALLSTIVSYWLAGRALKPIEEVHEKQRRFLADASHELKTPITAMRISVDVALRDKKLKLTEAKIILKQVKEQLHHMQNLALQLLQLSKTQQEIPAHFEPVELSAVIKDVVKQLEPLATKKHVSIKKELKQVVVQGEESKLKEMLIVLVDNAITYNKKKGKVIISLKKQSKKAIVSVQDTGIGISTMEMDFIFDPFYRSSKSRSEEEHFGLGLAMAKAVAELHGGSITVFSEVGKGSEFRVELPV